MRDAGIGAPYPAPTNPRPAESKQPVRKFENAKIKKAPESEPETREWNMQTWLELYQELGDVRDYLMSADKTLRAEWVGN